MKEDLKVELGKNLKKVRERLNYTQKTMGECIQMGESAYSRVENGKISISAPILERLSREMGISADFIFTGTGNMFFEGSRNINKNDTPITISKENTPEELHSLLKDIQILKYSRYAILGQYHEMAINFRDEINALKEEFKSIKSGNQI